MSTSVQHAPTGPCPELPQGSFSLGVHGKLAPPFVHLRSWGHCPSQYPVPYFGPALFKGSEPMPPSAGISTK